MRAILIDKQDRVYPIHVSEKLRGGCIQLSDNQPLSARFEEWTQPIVYKVRTFQWRGQIVRKDGSELLDFFEEID